MSDVALLNPQAELEGARLLLSHAKLKRDEQKEVVTSRILPRDDYLAAMGAYLSLEALVNVMEDEYRRMVNK